MRKGRNQTRFNDVEQTQWGASSGDGQRPVVATLATDNYVDQAKALFAGLHRVARWKGEYLLLGHGVGPGSRSWFEDRGIHVKECDRIHEGLSARREVLFSKLRLFETDIKAWSNVVFLDADIIVRGSIDRLGRVRGFHAVPDVNHLTSRERFLDPEPEWPAAMRTSYRKLAEEFDLKSRGFNGGVMAFSTDLIRDGTFEEMKSILTRFHPLMRAHDEAVLTLYFCGAWRRLPFEYNTYLRDLGFSRNANAPGAVLHFVNCRLPWEADSPFHEEWTLRLRQSEETDFSSVVNAHEHGPAVSRRHRWSIRSRSLAMMAGRRLWRRTPMRFRRSVNAALGRD
jgi:hypothetical protein